MANVQLRNIHPDNMHHALDTGIHFAMQYPDRVGIRSCVLYAPKFGPMLIAYRTKSGAIVVRANEKEPRP
jgi:hypothetical protein